MNNATKEEIEETSSMSAGNVTIAAGKQQDDKELDTEEKLRSIIREALKLYAIKNKKLSQEHIEEQKIRQHIKKLLLKEKESKDPPPASTLEGVMRSLLNNIVPQIRIDYMKLQTNKEERRGFKDYFYNAVEQTIDLAHDQRNSEQDQELEEQEKIVLKSDDPDFISGVTDGTDETPKSKESGQEKSKNISSYFDRGQNFGETAFNSIKDRIQGAVYYQIVPEEYEQFVKVLNANLQAWFKIWDSNRTQDQGVPDESDLSLDLQDQGEPSQPEEQVPELEGDFEIELE
jgi:hypothetical protein